MAVLAACGLVLGPVTLTVATAEDLRDKATKVDRHLSSAHDDLEHSSARLRKATSALDAARTRLDEAQDRLAQTGGELAAAEAFDQQMQARLATAVARLDRAQADLDHGHRVIADQEGELGAIVVQNYQSGDPALMGLSMVLTSQDPAELTGQLNSVGNLIDAEAQTLSRLEASRVLLTVQEQEVTAAKVEVSTERRAAARTLVVKQRLEQQAADAEEQVRVLVGQRAKARSEAGQARRADLAVLRSLEQERDRIAGVLLERARAARARARATAAVGVSSVPGPSSGVLLRPVSGAVTSPYGMRTHPITGDRSMHDGVDFGSACGTPILAPADGTVVEQYFHAVWGNRVVIDHGFRGGAGLATISNHLSGYAVSPGERVREGQVIGYVGTTGWSTGCHLHFTVLRNGTAVDPSDLL